MRTWRVLMLGFGTVGQGAAACLRDAVDELGEVGCGSSIVGVVDPLHGSAASREGFDAEALLGCVERGESIAALDGAQPLGDGLEAIDQVDADVVFEMTPTDLRTGGVGLEHVRAALGRGRHVCTTNKGPFALAYRELRDLAASKGVQLRGEGTVMSGTPVLNLFEAGLRGAGLRGVRGILNGTCNFMLSEMESGSTYPDALREAQRLGYAETDPGGDIDGWDAAAKVTILANLLLGRSLTIQDVARIGITDLSAHAVAAAAQDGKRWRLVGEVREQPTGWEAVVEPKLLPATDALAGVVGPGNLLVFDTRELGEVAISGPGAGRNATGHALVSDLLAVHRASS